MQLDILNKVKSGQLSIDDALQQARMDREQKMTDDKVTLIFTKQVHDFHGDFSLSVTWVWFQC